MDRMQIVKNVYSAIEAGDFATVENYLHEDYQLTGPVPPPIGKSELLSLLKALKAGLPDFSFHLSDVKESQGKVMCSTNITGTQSKMLDLSFLGIPPQPATGIKVELPMERTTVEFIGEKVSRVNVEITEGGGLSGLLSQIGATTAVSP